MTDTPTPAQPEAVALTLFVDAALAAALIDKIVERSLPVSVSSVPSVVQTQAHAIKALEMQLAEQGRELATTKRRLKEAEDRLQFP